MYLLNIQVRQAFQIYRITVSMKSEQVIKIAVMYALVNLNLMMLISKKYYV